jgi:hypothetical protein
MQMIAGSLAATVYVCVAIVACRVFIEALLKWLNLFSSPSG